MLVLTRKPQEGFLIISPSGEQIQIMFIRVRSGSQIRLGVDPPNRDWKIHSIDRDGNFETPEHTAGIKIQRQIRLTELG